MRLNNSPANTWVEIHLGVLTDNIRALRSTVGPGTGIYFVVKSNAYGHGMPPIAQRAWEQGIKHFAVAHIEEALQLREALPNASIIIMGVLAAKDAAAAISDGFSVFVVDLKHAERLAREAAVTGKNLNCHVKVDTGMGRLGIYWEEAPDVIEQIHGLRGLHIEGLASHFACADSDDKHMAKQQIARFRHVIQECEKRELHCGVKHISNSGGILSSFEWDMDAVRPGILLYGYGCGRRQIARTLETRPILQWKSRIVQLRKVRKGFRISYESTYTVPQDTTVGIVDAGYADGYPRLLSNKAPVIVHGKRVPVIGRVTMNLMVVDLGPDTVAEEGDEVVLLGEQGDASVWADELAEYCNTIPYEILTGIRTDCRVVVE